MNDDGHPHAADLAARGVYDPRAPDGGPRLELLEYLLGLGATVEEIAAAGNDVAGLASTVVLRGNAPRCSLAEAAHRAGVPLETAIRLQRAAGLPDAGPEALTYTDEDVELLRIFDAGAQLLGADAVLQLVRVIGSSLARIADAEVAAFLTNVGGPLMVADPSGLELARANAAATTLLGEAGRAIDVLLRHHVEAAQRPIVAGDQDTTLTAVGFADLVGSTAIAQNLSISELGRLLAEFEELTLDTMVDVGGRTVKFIGDEVMFVASDPAACCEIALQLASLFSHHARVPPVRVGLAFGDCLSRDGDYFGPVVNLAARIVKRADPSEVRTSRALRTVLGDSAEYRFVTCGVEDLRGIPGETEIFTLERRAAGTP